MSDENKPFYTTKEINQLRTAAQHFKLDAPQEFWEKTAATLKKYCNGAGPERWNDLKRKALTSALKAYEAAFAIHDVDYEYQVVNQKQADKRLKKNMVKIWRKNFGIWRWFSKAGRVERLIVIPSVYAAVALAGSQAWKESIEDESK